MKIDYILCLDDELDNTRSRPARGSNRLNDDDHVEIRGFLPALYKKARDNSETSQIFDNFVFNVWSTCFLERVCFQLRYNKIRPEKGCEEGEFACNLEKALEPFILDALSNFDDIFSLLQAFRICRRQFPRRWIDNNP